MPEAACARKATRADLTHVTGTLALEATSERNKQLHLRFGFEVTDEIALPDGPAMWRMWRSPAGSGAAV